MNKLHPQELADLLKKPIAMDQDGVFFAYDSTPKPGRKIWGFDIGEHGVLEITHAIAKPDDCPEWDKAIWEPRVMPERGQLCLFADFKERLNLQCGVIAYLEKIQNSEYQYVTANNSIWRYCKPIDSVPARIDLDAY